MEKEKTKRSKKNNKNAKKKTEKQLSRQENIIRIAKALSIVLVILVLLFAAADKFGNITFSSVGDYFSAAVSGVKQGDGYPYYFESTTPENIVKINSDLLVLTDDSTFVLDSTARKLSSFQHTYSVPVIDSQNGRFVMFDVGGNSYRVQSKTKVLYEETTGQKILTAAIGKDGSVLVATRGNGSVSELTVKNKNQKEVFKWSCAKESIISADISDNGKYAVVSLVGAENGELYSKVKIFDFDYSQPVSEYEFGSGIVSCVEFLSGSNVLASGENVMSFINTKSERTDIDLSLNTLSSIYTSENDLTAAVFSKYGSSSSKILRVYNKNGKELFSTEINSAVRSVSCEGHYISVLTDKQLLNYNKSGKQIGSAEVTSDGISCFTDGNNTYVLTTSAVKCYKTVGENEAETETETDTSVTQSVTE